MFGNPEESAKAGDEGAGGRDAAAAPGAGACPACGRSALRPGARFCATCGRGLDAADYFPTDSVRASYHQQRARPAALPAAAPREGRVRARRPSNARRPPLTQMPLGNSNGASTTAMAFVTYALVPYLGILFCPGAVVLGGVGLVRAHRAPHAGGRGASAWSLTLGVVILGAQLFLWWILYKIPEWSQQPPGF